MAAAAARGFRRYLGTGKSLSFVMPHRIPLPDAYVVARTSIADGGLWTGNLLRVTLNAVNNSAAVDIIDQEQTTATGDLKAIVLKISEPLLAEEFARLSESLQSVCIPGVNVRLLTGVTTPDQVLSPQDVSSEYFRREFAEDSSEVKHTNSCVRLTHLPTGYTARSTTHRSRALNYEEALFLLASLLGSKNDEA
jgi:hypothetical protein